jgi:hypothetical protein
MIKNLFNFMIFGLLLFSCAEKENPETIFGEYLPQSIIADQALDLTGDGNVSENLLAQLESKGEYSGLTFLNLYSPEYFNVNFSQVILRLPHHFEFENKVYLEFYQNGRRVDKESNGAMSLSWNTYPYQFEFPEQIHEEIIIETLKTNLGNNNVELVTSQRLFNHSEEEWVDARVTYTFQKVNH